jgi:Fe-coproporphyrin III synthase
MFTQTSTQCETANATIGGIRTIQIHPTLRCNLKCRHCYSFSAPSLKKGLSVEDLKHFLKYAYSQGFNAISFSGGEPFIFDELEETISYAKSIGFLNAVVTNGMLLGSQKAKRILSLVDLVAVSIDGKSELHDYIRGQKGAFKKMLEGVEILKNHQQNFGFIHTITNQSWEDLLWLGEFAFKNGAKLLQLHPLENSGRANEELKEGVLSEMNLHKSFIIANYLKTKYEGKMDIQLDLSHRDYLVSFPETFGINCNKNNPKNLIDYISNIVIDENGEIFPIAYGISKYFSLGNIKEMPEVDGLFPDYVAKKANNLKNLYQTTFDRIMATPNMDLINWSELIIEDSYGFGLNQN